MYLQRSRVLFKFDGKKRTEYLRVNIVSEKIDFYSEKIESRLGGKNNFFESSADGRVKLFFLTLPREPTLSQIF